MNESAIFLGVAASTVAGLATGREWRSDTSAIATPTRSGMFFNPMPIASVTAL